MSPETNELESLHCKPPCSCQGKGKGGSDKNSRDDDGNVVGHVTQKIMRQIEARKDMIALSSEDGLM